MLSNGATSTRIVGILESNRFRFGESPRDRLPNAKEHYTCLTGSIFTLAPVLKATGDGQEESIEHLLFFKTAETANRLYVTHLGMFASSRLLFNDQRFET